ncbi:MAG: DOMON-like domain-containing protein [Sulfurifustaceae bacterium]
MPSRLPQTVTLIPHPAAVSTAVRRVTGRVVPLPGDRLRLTYFLEGTLDRIRLPARRAARFADELWRHTCCEIFIRRKDNPAYHEVNLSPSGEWALYAFRRYRERVPLDTSVNIETFDPEIAIQSADHLLALDAVVPLEHLSPDYVSTHLELGLSVVVEDEDGLQSYWALKHPVGKPDFHHPTAFVLELA